MLCFVFSLGMSNKRRKFQFFSNIIIILNFNLETLHFIPLWVVHGRSTKEPKAVVQISNKSRVYTGYFNMYMYI